ncbi:MAG: DEAD/DEAH box helicase [Saprospiraceae bacterium]|nr:DEAD/DEAH box helicase [Saprospiraceae bacterium]MDW8483124.1 DEAD/DEAH box helicase [Saprospiraceae bacterium]
MRFEKYPIAEEIKQNLADLGWRRPTDIQYKAIPHILSGEDVLAVAQTGTGKTAAFAIPIVHLLHEAKRSSRSDGVRCVVLEPTRELAVQIAKVFQALARHTRVRVLDLFGGVEQEPQIARLLKGVDVVVATPGRLFDLHAQGYLPLDKVCILAVDEADRMLQLGFLQDIQDLIKRLPRRRQTLFFSATLDTDIKRLAYSLVRSNAIRIQISPQDPVSKNVQHAVVFIRQEDKRFFLERFLREHPEKKVLVFVRTRVRAERVQKAMERVGLQALYLHGAKNQHERLQTLEAFRNGTVRTLIATDVSARGIDIPDVDYVINYDLPEAAENYVHRVGRTGRGQRKGQALSFCSDEERALLQRIEAYLGKKIAVLEVDDETYAETLRLSEDVPDKWRDIMAEIEAAEKWFEGRRRSKKANSS